MSVPQKMVRLDRMLDYQVTLSKSNIMSVSQKMDRLERMLDYQGVPPHVYLPLYILVKVDYSWWKQLETNWQ